MDHARCTGFKSHDTSFGYGGFDYGGYGNVGKYGGYRSSYHYPSDLYHDKFHSDNAHIYTISPYLASNEYVAPTWHKPTFVFAFFLLAILFIGLWFGHKQNIGYYRFAN